MGALILAALLAGGALLFFVLRSSDPAAAAPNTAALSVTTTSAYRADWDGKLEAGGVVEAWQEAIIGAQSAGQRLLEVRVNVGDTVRRGQLLARFDDAMLRAELAQLDASLRQAGAASAQAGANHQRALRLQGSGSVSEQEVLAQLTQASTAAAQVAVVRAQLAAKRLELDYTRVLAPDDGLISARNTTLGAVAANGQELFRLIRQGRLEWRGELTAQQLAQIAPGQSVQLGLPDGSSASARVRQTGARLDAQSRLVLVYADIAPGSRARAGMSAGGQVRLAAAPALVAPAAAVVIRDGRNYVFTVDENPAADGATVRAQLVQIGRRLGDAVEIVHGLAEGQRVVLAGAGFLNDGDSVRILPAAAAAAAAKGGA